MTEITSAIDERLPTFRDELFDLLSQPSISVTGEGMEECSGVLSEILKKRKFDNVKQIETEQYPIIYAERFIDESAPTVAFYGHYDVQPPGERVNWESPPFEPTIRNESIYARGSGDNKGQLLTHVFALDILDEVTEGPPVNVKLLFEGGEENSSIGLISYLTDNPRELKDVDLIYVADGPMHPSYTPTIIYGNRGILSLQLDLETADSDLHSGNFGGPVPNASNELVEVLASMFSGDKVTIEGFYDDIEISNTSQELAADIPFDEQHLMESTGITNLVTDKPYYERLLLEPTLTINGIYSGYSGEGKKTIIPHKATAKLDSRLVPNQNPDQIFKQIDDYVTNQNPNIEVSKMGTFPPMKTPINTPAADPLKEALQAVWGIDPIEMPMLGGSLPAAHFRSELGVPVLVIPYANPDQGNHSPNEHLDLKCFRNGIETTAQFLTQLKFYDIKQ